MFILLKKIQHAIATLGFLGYFPYAPGTVGSAAGFLLVLVMKPDDRFLLISILFVLLVGIVTSGNTEKILGKDSGHIIIDELCGYLISVLFIPKTFSYLLAAFILFRAFDILKPPPINKVEEILSGGAGIMFDDVAAGIGANLFLRMWILVAAG